MTWVWLRLATEQAKLGTTCSGGILGQNEMQLPLERTEGAPLHPFLLPDARAHRNSKEPGARSQQRKHTNSEIRTEYGVTARRHANTHAAFFSLTTSTRPYANICFRTSAKEACVTATAQLVP